MTKLSIMFPEIEEEYLEEDYNYIDGYDDEYYADGEEYFDEYSGGPNRGDQSLVSPESKPRLCYLFLLQCFVCSLNLAPSLALLAVAPLSCVLCPISPQLKEVRLYEWRPRTGRATTGRSTRALRVT